MNKALELTGKRFGKLVAIERAGSNKWGNSEWLCKCDCGNEKIAIGYKLKNGHTVSCGCVHRLSKGKASMRQVINRYKNQSKKRGFEYNLSEEQFKDITQQNCHYCGAKPSQIKHDIGVNGEYVYNGIDRIDNTKGYTIDNVVPCCCQCNFSKGKLTLQEFKEWVTKVYKNIQ